jgi:hypothetical protein
MSFVGGPYFAALRERILKSASVLRLDLIDKRSDVFLDVLYDLCVVVLRKSGGPGRPSTPKSSLLRIGEPDLDLGLIDLPAQPDKRVWVLPDVKDNNTLFRPGFETLAGYGISPRGLQAMSRNATSTPAALAAVTASAARAL